MNVRLIVHWSIWPYISTFI